MSESAPIPAVERTGIELGVSADDYHRRERYVVSNTALGYLERSPAHYLAWLHGAERKQTAALSFGTAMHMAQLEPDRFRSTYVVEPDFGDGRTKEAKAEKAAWLADQRPGALFLKAAEDVAILDMIEAVLRHPAASRLVLEGEPEVTLRWVDPETGIRCKARPDYWVKAKRFNVDIKTCADGSVEGFAKAAANHAYHRQDALYRDGFRVLGEPIEHHAIIAVEKTKPHAVAVYTLDEEAVTKGYVRARQGIERLADCVKRNEWPAYHDGISSLTLPRWAA